MNKRPDRRIKTTGRARSGLTTVCLMFADGAAAGLAVWTAVLLRAAWGGTPLGIYADISPLFVVHPLVCAGLGLYTPLLSPAEELKRLVLASAVFLLFLGSLTFLSRNAHLYSRIVFTSSFVGCVLFGSFIRGAVRRFGERFDWWGRDVVVVAKPATAARLIGSLKLTPGAGLFARCVVSPEPQTDFPERLDRAAAKFPNALALTPTPGAAAEDRERIFQIAGRFDDMVLSGFGLGDARPCTQALLGDASSFYCAGKVRENRRAALKRVVDVLLGVLLAAATLPILLLCMGLVLVFDGRPALFRQTRLGLRDKPFALLKLRTMTRARRADFLSGIKNDPEIKAQWRGRVKLKRDPRLTRTGGFLRSFSLDELPQLFNVLKGDMSLVGPRPVRKGERRRTGMQPGPEVMVKPGMTGLWQILGRNDLSLAERARLDDWYARNWSLWLDFAVLLRTPAAVLSRRGAV